MQIVYRYDPCSSIRGITKHLACFELVVAAPLKVKPVVTVRDCRTRFEILTPHRTIDAIPDSMNREAIRAENSFSENLFDLYPPPPN
jgi:hypothetical protein